MQKKLTYLSSALGADGPQGREEGCKDWEFLCYIIALKCEYLLLFKYSGLPCNTVAQCVALPHLSKKVCGLRPG